MSCRVEVGNNEPRPGEEKDELICSSAHTMICQSLFSRFFIKSTTLHCEYYVTWRGNQDTRAQLNE